MPAPTARSRSCRSQNAGDFRNFPQQVRGGASTLSGGYGRTHRFVLRSVASLPYDVSMGLTGNFESGFLYPARRRSGPPQTASS